MRKIFLTLITCGALLGAIAGGLAMAPFLAVRLGMTPYHGVHARGGEALDSIIEIIRSSEKSVVVATENFDNSTVYNELADAKKRGVKVLLLVPPGPRTVQLQRLCARDGLDMVQTVGPFRGTTVLVDQKIAAESAWGLKPRRDFEEEQVLLRVSRHAATHREIEADLMARTPNRNN